MDSNQRPPVYRVFKRLSWPESLKSMLHIFDGLVSLNSFHIILDIQSSEHIAFLTAYHTQTYRTSMQHVTTERGASLCESRPVQKAEKSTAERKRRKNRTQKPYRSQCRFDGKSE